MNIKYVIVAILIACFCFISCSNNHDVSIDIYKWETSIMHTTYFYEVENNSNKNLMIIFVVEATCEDNTVYSDEEWIDVSSGKKRKSSIFFSTDGKKVENIEVVDIRTRRSHF